jgi:uncharacterized protein YeaO (DUF488 family)
MSGFWGKRVTKPVGVTRLVQIPDCGGRLAEASGFFREKIGIQPELRRSREIGKDKMGIFVQQKTLLVQEECERTESSPLLAAASRGERTVIQLKRAYEKARKQDGMRILVERLWPRGVSKEKAAIDLWVKDLAPSPALRKWYGHDPKKWPEFRKRYLAELRKAGEAMKQLEALVKAGTVTFVYAAADERRNSALLLKEYLERRTCSS